MIPLPDHVLFVLLALLNLCGPPRSRPMPVPSLNWTVISVPAGKSGIPRSVMLAPHAASASLLFTEADDWNISLWHLRLPVIDPIEAAQIQLLSPNDTPSDVSVQKDDSLSLVSTRAGSGRCQLFYRDLRGNEANFVNHLYESGIFVRPHFVQHAAHDHAIIDALAIVGGKTIPVLFQPGIAQNYGEYIVLPQPANGNLLDERLLPYGSGYLLLTRLSLPHIAAERSLGLHISVPLGILYGTVLDKAFRPIGEPVRIIGDTQVYEFDADVHGNDIVLLATTATGFELAVGPLDRGKIDPKHCQAIPWERPLASPAVVTVSDWAQAAIIDSPGDPGAKIMTSRFGL